MLARPSRGNLKRIFRPAAIEGIEMSSDLVTGRRTHQGMGLDCHPSMLTNQL